MGKPAAPSEIEKRPKDYRTKCPGVVDKFYYTCVTIGELDLRVTQVSIFWMAVPHFRIPEQRGPLVWVHIEISKEKQ